jgi:hypothetical protein
MSVFSKPFVAPQKNQATAMPVRQPIDGCGRIAAKFSALSAAFGHWLGWVGLLAGGAAQICGGV